MTLSRSNRLQMHKTDDKDWSDVTFVPLRIREKPDLSKGPVFKLTIVEARLLLTGQEQFYLGYPYKWYGCMDALEQHIPPFFLDVLNRAEDRSMDQ